MVCVVGVVGVMGVVVILWWILVGLPFGRHTATRLFQFFFGIFLNVKQFISVLRGIKHLRGARTRRRSPACQVFPVSKILKYEYIHGMWPCHKCMSKTSVVPIPTLAKLLCLELPCLVQGYSRSALHTCSMWRADSVHVMELLSDSI